MLPYGSGGSIYKELNFFVCEIYERDDTKFFAGQGFISHRFCVYIFVLFGGSKQSPLQGRGNFNEQ